MGFLDWLLGDSPPASVRPPAGTRAGTRAVRNTQPFYAERGWQVRGNSLHGWYRTRQGAFEGRIDQPFGESAQYSIINPPKELLDGPHGSCFRQRDRNRFEIHWNTRPRDVNAGILQLEHLLIEALK